MRAYRLQVIRSIGLLIALCWLTSVRAVVVEDLYSAMVPVGDRSEQTRREAMTPALKQVLVKIIGNPQYLAREGIQSALSRPQKYLEAYGYSSNDLGETVLSTRFSQSSVNALLAGTQTPFWPANRPRVLVWLVTRDFQSGVQAVLPITTLDDDGAPVFAQLEVIGERIGLPVVSPLMDLEDQLQIQPQQLWSLDSNAIKQASLRYGVDHILVGRVTATSGGQWRIGWWYWADQTFDVFDSSQTQLQQALTEGLNQVTGKLARTYGVLVTGEQGLALSVTVSGVNKFSDYAATLNYFDQMAAVREYELRQVASGELTFTLYLNGDINRFRDALALDKKMEPVTVLGVPGAASGLNLRWISTN